jgi:diaminohydroxyphosphoribosylaminopyrimidine deaminase/5-amino-6-(5-phosphoribosylamino)uracil reductase
MDVERSQKPEFYWISNQELKVFSHKLRNEEQAILIGYNTLVNDQPKLTNRLFGEHQPYRFVASKDVLKTPPTSFTVLLSVPKELLRELYIRKIQSVIIEGGKKTIQQFIDAELWDEAIVYVGDQEWKEGLLAPQIDETDSKISCHETSIVTNILKQYSFESPLMSNFDDYLRDV